MQITIGILSSSDVLISMLRNIPPVKSPTEILEMCYWEGGKQEESPQNLLHNNFPAQLDEETGVIALLAQ